MNKMTDKLKIELFSQSFRLIFDKHKNPIHEEILYRNKELGEHARLAIEKFNGTEATD
jgi:hypothetical protein